ncbi:protein rapunzel-like [Chanodichthys erythropterus]|uniref:protein rapunzel-like n=1 Tax=Chanodichthys erythropterus TaxID=933992 RepID=UPI00351F3C04
MSHGEWYLEKENIEKLLEMIGQGCKVLAATVGQFHPILKAVFLASAKILSNPDGKEAKFFTEQFEKINQKLDSIQDEMNEITLELELSTMNKQNFDYEVNINTQYEKFKEFVSANKTNLETRQDNFKKQYEITGRDKNIDALYEAVMKSAILDTVVKLVKKDRKKVEQFCARLKMKFFMGIVAVVAYSALEGEYDEGMLKTWQNQMEEVENRMQAAVNACE